MTKKKPKPRDRSNVLYVELPDDAWQKLEQLRSKDGVPDSMKQSVRLTVYKLIMDAPLA